MPSSDAGRHATKRASSQSRSRDARPSGRSGTSRRAVLAASAGVAVTAAGGCLERIRGATSSSRDLALFLSARDGSLRERHVEDLDETRIPWDEEAFSAALAGETYTTTYREPFYARDEPTYARHDGTYYELGSVVVDEVTHTHPVVRLATVGRTDQLDSVPDHVAHSELPQTDRRAVQIAYMAARARGNEGGVPWDLVERGGYVYRDPDDVEASRLLDESGPSHVAFRDRIYAVEVTHERFHEPVYRPTVEPVADSEDAMEEILRARLVDAHVDRESLSEDARSVLLDARRDEGYAESHPYSDAFETVLRQLGERAYVDGDVRNDAIETGVTRKLLRYDGRYFDYRLEFDESGQ